MFIYHLSIKVAGTMELIPAVREERYTLGRLANLSQGEHTDNQPLTPNKQFRPNLQVIGRKPEHPKEALEMGRTGKRKLPSRFEPRTFLLRGDGTNHPGSFDTYLELM